MSMGAGEFNRKIVVSALTGAVDANNQALDEWLPVFPDGLWAKILGQNGMGAIRSAEAGVPIAPGRYSFRIRYRPVGITTAMRVEYQGVAYDIRGIRHDLDRHEFTDLVCETGSAHV